MAHELPRVRISSWERFLAPNEEAKGLVRRMIREWLRWHWETFSVTPELGVPVCVIGFSIGAEFVVIRGPPKSYQVDMKHITWP